MQRGRDERFAGASRRVEDDVLFVEQFEDSGFLRRIKLEPPARDVIEKFSQQHVVADFLIARNQIVKGCGHGTRTLFIPGAAEKEDAKRLPKKIPPDLYPVLAKTRKRLC